jgi:hypothetical protein
MVDVGAMLYRRSRCERRRRGCRGISRQVLGEASAHAEPYPRENREGRMGVAPVTPTP